MNLLQKEAPASDIWKIKWLKGPKWASQAHVLLSALVVDNQMI